VTATTSSKSQQPTANSNSQQQQQPVQQQQQKHTEHHGKKEYSQLLKKTIMELINTCLFSFRLSVNNGATTSVLNYVSPTKPCLK
jgi:hypothetical protein